MLQRSALRYGLVSLLLYGWVSASSSVWAQAAAPGPEHKKLEMFVGEWNFVGERKAMPELGVTDAGTVAEHQISEMANGGFFLETRSGIGTPDTTLWVFGYNAASKNYRRDGYTSRGGVRTFQATVDGLVWSFVGTNTRPDGSSGTKERYTLTFAPDLKSAAIRSEHSMDGVTWYERLTGTYTKASGR